MPISNDKNIKKYDLEENTIWRREPPCLVFPNTSRMPTSRMPGFRENDLPNAGLSGKMPPECRLPECRAFGKNASRMPGFRENGLSEKIFEN